MSADLNLPFLTARRIRLLTGSIRTIRAAAAILSKTESIAPLSMEGSEPCASASGVTLASGVVPAAFVTIGVTVLSGAGVSVGIGVGEAVASSEGMLAGVAAEELLDTDPAGVASMTTHLPSIRASTQACASRPVTVLSG